MKGETTLAPKQCKTDRQTWDFNRESFETMNYSIRMNYQFNEPLVVIGKLQNGLECKIPKKDFDKLIAWYLRPQKIRGTQK